MVSLFSSPTLMIFLLLLLSLAICVVIVFSMFFKNFSSSSFSADKKAHSYYL